MSVANSLRIPVADLLRRPGASKSVAVTAPVPGLGNGIAEVPADTPIAVDVTLERISEGIVVRGQIDAPWHSECSRCVRPVEATITVHVDEMFEPNPLAGETYALGDDSLDLEPLVRDAVLLELPATPLCADDCTGLCPTCGIDRDDCVCDSAPADLDPRWAALRSLDS